MGEPCLIPLAVLKAGQTTPLTAEERRIQALGIGLRGRLEFTRAYSSDSGRAIQTMGIILDELGEDQIPYRFDKRIREWCFGSFDGAYGGDSFMVSCRAY